jgi:glucose/arabinose dehydrogenase
MIFDASGQLWAAETGPGSGDELNRIIAGGNYGWPLASNGSVTLPAHRPGDGFLAPAISWTPAVGPVGMWIYSGSRFAAWNGNLLIAGRSSNGLVRVQLSGATATELGRVDFNQPVRDVDAGSAGAILVTLESPGRVVQVIPRQ